MQRSRSGKALAGHLSLSVATGPALLVVVSAEPGKGQWGVGFSGPSHQRAHRGPAVGTFPSFCSANVLVLAVSSSQHISPEEKPGPEQKDEDDAYVCSRGRSESRSHVGATRSDCPRLTSVVYC